jgi:hypothetical protein
MWEDKVKRGAKVVAKEKEFIWTQKRDSSVLTSSRVECYSNHSISRNIITRSGEMK